MKNFFDIPDKYSQYEKSKTVILSYPFEKSTSYLKGTSQAPLSILEASRQVELFDTELKCEPYLSGIHTYNPGLDNNLEREDIFKYIYETTRKIINGNKFAVSLGGEHTISYPIVKSIVENHTPDISIIHFDAHSDLRNEYEGSLFSHASVMRRIRELTENTLSIGVRSQCIEEYNHIIDNKIKIEYKHNILDFDKIRREINELTDNIYITFDVDVLDPSVMPSTGTPEPNGLSWNDVCLILKFIFSNKNVIAMDFVELMPIKNLKYPDFTIARLIYKCIGLKFYSE